MGANPGDVYLCPCGTRLGVGRRGETLVLDPILALLLALVLTLAPLLARAEVQPVLKGEPAPLTGLVMDEMTFMRYANTEVALAGCKVEGEAARAQVNALAASSATSAANAPSAPSSGYFWLGAITGAAAAVLVLYGAAQLLKAAPAERAARQGAR